MSVIFSDGGTLEDDSIHQVTQVDVDRVGIRRDHIVNILSLECLVAELIDLTLNPTDRDLTGQGNCLSIIQTVVAEVLVTQSTIETS